MAEDDPFDDCKLVREPSPMDAWDAADECHHGLLPHEACAPCQRAHAEGVLEAWTYPGIRAIVRAERALAHDVGIHDLLPGLVDNGHPTEP
jgi:hypothetical protein